MSDFRSKCLLLVDDDAEYLEALRMIARSSGFGRVITAIDGDDALNKLRDERFDLIISDWNMEPIDGLSLLRSVRKSSATSRIPFILITASLTETAWRGAIEFGATDFLIKPISLATLRGSCHLSLALGGAQSDNIIQLRDRKEGRRSAY